MGNRRAPPKSWQQKHWLTLFIYCIPAKQKHRDVVSNELGCKKALLSCFLRVSEVSSTQYCIDFHWVLWMDEVCCARRRGNAVNKVVRDSTFN